MPDINKATRIRIIMDLLKNGNVTTPTDYNNLDKMPAPAATQLASDTWNAYTHEQLFDDQDPPQPRDPTPSDHRKFWLNKIKETVALISSSASVKDAGATAAAEQRELEKTKNEENLGELEDDDS